MKIILFGAVFGFIGAVVASIIGQYLRQRKFRKRINQIYHRHTVLRDEIKAVFNDLPSSNQSELHRAWNDLDEKMEELRETANK